MQTISSINTIGVSWGAIFAGAVASAAVALILLILGFGLGLSVISPWADAGISAAAIGISTIIWLTVTQITASGLGGYLTGRLRLKWTDLHRDEVYFRDTAHGLISWAVATLIAMVMVTSSIGFALSAGANATAEVAGSVASDIAEVESVTAKYWIDNLLRSDNQLPDEIDTGIRSQLTTIILHDLIDGGISNVDTKYAAKLVANYTGLSQQQAEIRVTQTIERARQAVADAEVATLQAVETARESAAYAALWLFIALLSGAFSAGVMAVIGGRQRDDQVLTFTGDAYAAPARS